MKTSQVLAAAFSLLAGAQAGDNGTYPTTEYPTSTSYPTSYPESSYPESTYPASTYPASSYPASSYPESSYPASTYPASSYPVSTYSASTYPESSYPASTYPESSYPASTYSESSYPASTYPASTYPESSYPASTYPVSTYSASSYPTSPGASSYITYSANGTTTAIYTTATISVLTTYCPSPTVVTYSSGSYSETYSVSTSGTATIPLITVSQVVPPPITPTNTPLGPSASTTGPVQVTNDGKRLEAAAGAFVAAGVALLLL